MDTKPASFLAHAVKAVFVTSATNDDDYPRTARLLSACSGLESLTIHDTTQYATLANLRPYRLSTCLEDIQGLPAGPAFPQLFSRITHLELASEELQTPMRAFEELPALTHLALFSDALDALPELLCILRACRALEMLLSSLPRGMGHTGEAVRSKEDPRLFFCQPQSIAVDREDYAVGDDIWKKALREADSSA